MTNKEKFLQNIQNKIKVLEDAYNSTKNLPDDVFETLNTGVTNIAEPALPEIEDDAPSGYGRIKKVVVDFIGNKPKAVAKKAITLRVQEVFKTDDKKAASMTTNAITGLVKSNVIVSAKRGFYKKVA